MAERRTLTDKQLKARLDLCRDYGVVAYEETADGAVKFTLGPRIVATAPPEPITEEERTARRVAEFRKVATAHTRGMR